MDRQITQRSIRALQPRSARQVLASLVLLACVTATGSVAAGTSSGNAVTHWNANAEEVFKPTQGLNPLAQSRTLAIMHAAIHDVLNAIDPRFQPYTPGLAAAPGASADAAVAAAARDVLIALVPERAILIEAQYGESLSRVHGVASKAAGIAAGRASAAATLARRRADGLDAATQPLFVPRPGAGEYQFTAPFDFANLPGWGNLQPFVIDLKKHGVDGPLDLAGARYARDFEHVKAIGAMNSSTRTAEQSEIARFWYEDSPLGWNRIANTVVRQRELDLWSSARAFALVNFALADGFIAGFDAKYEFRFWRPVTAIRDAARDGNALTNADPSWEPFLITPPVPDYPSTHTVLGAAAAEVLIQLFGDNVRFSATSLTLPGVTRRYQRFSDAARENGLSRVYAGIHFQHAVKDGYRQGRSVGQTVAQSLESVP